MNIGPKFNTQNQNIESLSDYQQSSLANSTSKTNENSAIPTTSSRPQKPKSDTNNGSDNKTDLLNENDASPPNLSNKSVKKRSKSARRSKDGLTKTPNNQRIMTCLGCKERKLKVSLNLDDTYGIPAC